MKKVLLSLAAFSIVCVGCNKDDDKTTDKLPSKMTYSITYPDEAEEPNIWFIAFEYDGQNRMTKISYSDGGYDEISYNSDNTISKIFEFDGYDTAYCQTECTYNGNSMVIKRTNWYHQGDSVSWRNDRDTLTLSDGRVTKQVDGERTQTFTYNANGNVTRYEYAYGTYSGGTDFEYTDIKSIFRNVNMPDWLLRWEVDDNYSKSGYMLKKSTGDDGDVDEYTYETTGDYVSKRIYTMVEEDYRSPKKHILPKTKQQVKRSGRKEPYSHTETVTFEYVNAK